MDKKEKRRERQKSSPDKKISRRLKSEAVKAHRDESPKSTTKATTKSSTTIPTPLINVDCFAEEEELSKNFTSMELYLEFSREAERLINTMDFINANESVKKKRKDKIEGNVKTEPEGEQSGMEQETNETLQGGRIIAEELKSSEQFTSEKKLKHEAEDMEIISTPIWDKKGEEMWDLKPTVSAEGKSISKKSSHHAREQLVEGWMSELYDIMNKLKKINRMEKHRSKNVRDNVSEMKQKLDEKQLQYQNLKSELAYLKNETNSCLEFESECSNIDLISVEDFYREAPPEISNREVTQNDEHELMLARLKWDLEERKLLANEMEAMEEKKRKIKAKVKNLMDCLRNVKPMLKNIQQAVVKPFESMGAPPAQVYFNGYAEAKFLPEPLRHLYLQLQSYASIYNDKESWTAVNVIQTEMPRSAVYSATSDSEFDLSEMMDISESKDTTWSTEQSVELKEKTDESQLKEHKLSVQWIISYEGNKLIVVFSYVTSLNFVKVKTKKLFPNPSLYILPNKLLKTDGFLDNLLPDENDRDILNPKIRQLASDLGISDLHCIFYDAVEKPYIWAQKMADLHSKNTDNRYMIKDVSYDIQQAKYVRTVVMAVKARMKSRISLSSEIGTLASKNRPPTAVTSMLPYNIDSRLKYFKDALPADISSYPDYKILKEEEIFTDECFLYKLEIERGSALLQALVIVPPNYPLKTPVFLLFLHWKGSFNNINNIYIKELEHEVNVLFIDDIPEELKYYTLLCQVYHLRACFDIYLETHPTNDVIEGPAEFAKDKIIDGVVKGRSHSRPYKYVPSLKLFTLR